MPNTVDDTTYSNPDGSAANTDRADSINNSDAVFDTAYNALNDTAYNVVNANDRTGVASDFVKKLNINSLAGIEGIPYQFLPSVDRRIDFTTGASLEEGVTQDSMYTFLGRKYAEKIVANMPILFMAPCNPRFMDDKSWTGSDAGVVASSLLGGLDSGLEDLLDGSGRFYSAGYAYNQYYNYLNVMLTCVVHFLGIEHEKILINGEEQELWKVDWSQECNNEFSNTFLAKQNLAFYIDSIDSISENFANSTMQSQIAGLVNGFSDTAKELSFFFGNGDDGSLLGNAINALKDAAGGISAKLSDLGTNIAGPIVGSLLDGGLASIIDGGKIIFPEMWSDSSYDKSYSVGMKLRSPDNDTLSIFLNVLKPYCKILCMTLPHMIGNNVNAYKSPFICKAYCKGLFNIDLGMITALSVTKGATCCWNDDGLPTQIDLDIEIKDLYSQLSMTAYTDDQYSDVGLISGVWNDITKAPKQLYNIVNNTAYMDFLANMAGLNINEMEWSRKALMYYDLAKNRVVNLGNEVIGGRFHQAITDAMSYIYNIL